MYRSSVESFIRSGGGRALLLRHTPLSLGLKQDGPTGEATVSPRVDDVWNRSFGATTQAILRTKPFEFSAAGLSGLDQEALRADAVNALLAAMEREGFDLTSAEGEQRALAVLSDVLNQRQQEAMGADIYVWTTQHDAQVRGSHADPMTGYSVGTTLRRAGIHHRITAAGVMHGLWASRDIGSG